MQRLSMIAVTALAVLALSGAGFTQKSTPAPTPTLLPAQTSAPAAKTFVNYYYWYDVILYEWNDYETTPWEIWEMETYFDCTVNTNPAGGTLIEEGFITDQYPNPYGVMVFLYAHF
jgi:hypothetical protein